MMTPLSRTMMNGIPSRQNGPRRLTTLGCLSIGVGICVVALFLVAGAIFVWRTHSDRLVTEQLAAIRARGEPVTPADLAASYVRSEQAADTGDLWLRAIRVFGSTEFSQDATFLPVVGSGGPVPPPHQPWSQFEPARQFLSEYSTSIDLLHAAARSRNSVRYDVDACLGTNAETPHLNPLRSDLARKRVERRGCRCFGN
jgi:hypothetical protein